MARTAAIDRHIGLVGATGIGVSAIVGGGILALAGVAFATAGPAAILAFVLNGVIAIITALSFAELATRFPESGGAYTFSKKVLSVEAAFVVGWVVWFASIVAGVLYAVGFATFAVLAIRSVVAEPPQWLGSPALVPALAIVATLGYMLILSLRSGGGGQFINIAKLIAFAILIAGGMWALARGEAPRLDESMMPFIATGAAGVVAAMGFTFIALQGFDLIAAVGGEVREPAKNLPRAMILSLSIALLVYVPLLFVVASAGVVEGEGITELSREHTGTVVAVAAGRFLGGFGYWLVIVAAVLSMLSALQANLLAASRVAFAMSRDHTLPRQLRQLSRTRRIPVRAVAASALAIAIVLLVLSDVASAGAAASLIFLISFALVHWMTMLARVRGPGGDGIFTTPWFPLFPFFGLLACLGLAIFQGIAVPSAGLIGLVWVSIGVVLYIVVFARRARVIDASSEAFDPDLVRLRGRSPLVLVPVANPANAEAMVAVADAIAPPRVGRVMLLNVIRPPDAETIEEDPRSLLEGQIVVREAIAASFTRSLLPEALLTIASDPLPEIVRVAREHRCQCLLLGLSRLDEAFDSRPLEDLMLNVGCNVAILRARQGWRLANVRRVLVPMGGRNQHDAFRARLLGSLQRTGERAVTFMRVLPAAASDRDVRDAERDLHRFVHDEVRGEFEVRIVRADSVTDAVTGAARESDLVVMGLSRGGRRRRRFFGEIAIRIARESDCAILMLSRAG